MQPDSTFISKIFSDTGNILEFFSLLVAIISLIIIIIPSFHRWWQNYHDRRSLRKRLGADLYTRENILNATQYYIEPSCQDVDPTQEEEIRAVHGVQAELFNTIDKQLANPKKYRFMIILADSGMGKTSFVLNYYARHWRSSRRRRRFNLALVPLGIPDADSYIKNIPDQSNTVIFLDAFDEDTRAIQDYRQRLGQLLKLCANFQQILITSRTQFFLREEEIPRETGIVKIGAVNAGESREYQFYKLYLSPFSDEQVEHYLKRRFSSWKRKQRSLAKALVDKVPLLTVRPMLLAHIKELVQSGKTFQYSFQIYEEMVEAWLRREEPFVKDKIELRKFSEQLAIDLYMNAKKRGSERIHYSELEPLAKTFGITLQGWQLRGRSLLNRDGTGNYKFAHRSIMEYLFVKKFLELWPSKRPLISWTDQMKNFYFEIIFDDLSMKFKLPNLVLVRLLKSHHIESLMKSRYVCIIKLRTRSHWLLHEEVNEMLRHYDFFDAKRNGNGNGIPHFYYEIKTENRIIFDLITGLMWQKGGSLKLMKYEDAQNWVKKLNIEKHAGYKDWRLPTLEEAMSLIEPNKNKYDLYVDPVFDQTQKYIWTGDQVQSAIGAWVVDFNSGDCDSIPFHVKSYIRAVRLDQSFTQ